MLKLEKVTYRYSDGNDIEALNEVSLEIKKGGCTGLAGPVGSGKTTLALLLAGLIKPTSGTVIFDGKVIGKEIKQHQFWPRMGILLQQSENQIFETTVYEEIAFALKNKGYNKEKIKEKVESSIQKIGLDRTFLKRSPFKLSGGEKRLVAIASVISYDPEILIFDEPTAGLDKKAKESLLSYISGVKGSKTIIIISHDSDELLICDSVAILKDGKLLGHEPLEKAVRELFGAADLSLPAKWHIAEKLRECGLSVNESDSDEVITEKIKAGYGLS